MTARINILIHVLTGLLVSGCQTVGQRGLSTFKSDGCSCFPDGTSEQPDLWKRHCIEHDHAYWKGGTRQERKAADLKLRDGIQGEGNPVIARIAYAGVRIGGTPWLPTPWRWGFGWSYPRGYRELDEAEETEIEKRSGGNPSADANETPTGSPRCIKR